MHATITNIVYHCLAYFICILLLLMFLLFPFCSVVFFSLELYQLEFAHTHLLQNDYYLFWPEKFQ